jgi:hypothetical protein
MLLIYIGAYERRDTDPTPVDQISWCKVVRAPSRPFGQKTNLLSQYHQGFGNRDVRVAEIVERELEKPNLTSGDTCMLANFGHRRRRGRCVLDTSGC